MRLIRYFHTLRYLKPSQIIGRVLFRLKKVKPDLRPHPALRQRLAQWIVPVKKIPRILGREAFCFMNIIHDIKTAADWNNEKLPKLWLYNLHYFDDLNSRSDQSGASTDWDNFFITRWIDENPPGYGNGWEPYPLSLRIVNWVKWLLRTGDRPVARTKEILDSLATQTRYLNQRLETHLLGNHLLANAKALLFAGLFFSGPEAKQWQSKSLAILEEQLQEQILADGGHFELSTMYQAIILEDLLDIINVLQTYQQYIPEQWLALASKMLDWLNAMTHPDGDIALFNDAALGIAATPHALNLYAERLGIIVVINSHTQNILLENSGYAHLTKNQAHLYADVAAIGPDYLPGHAHADTFTFEFSLGKQRIIVNSGTSLYENNSERLRQRSTPAHNTLTIDNKNSSNVWASFRVAERAKVSSVLFQENLDGTTLSAQHDGYKNLSGKVTHERFWRLTDSKLAINDNVTGSGVHQLLFCLHFHPDIILQEISKNIFTVHDKNHKLLAKIELDNRLTSKLEPCTYHPEFGKSIPNYKISATATCDLPCHLTSKIRYLL